MNIREALLPTTREGQRRNAIIWGVWLIVATLALVAVLLDAAHASSKPEPVQIGTAQSCTRAADGSPVCVES